MPARCEEMHPSAQQRWPPPTTFFPHDNGSADARTIQVTTQGVKNHVAAPEPNAVQLANHRDPSRALLARLTLLRYARRKRVRLHSSNRRSVVVGRSLLCRLRPNVLHHIAATSQADDSATYHH